MQGAKVRFPPFAILKGTASPPPHAARSKAAPPNPRSPRSTASPPEAHAQPGGHDHDCQPITPPCCVCMDCCERPTVPSVDRFEKGPAFLSPRSSPRMIRSGRIRREASSNRAGVRSPWAVRSALSATAFSGGKELVGIPDGQDPLASIHHRQEGPRECRSCQSRYRRDQDVHALPDAEPHTRRPPCLSQLRRLRCPFPTFGIEINETAVQGAPARSVDQPRP